MKKTIAVALACAAVLAACGGGGDGTPSSTAKISYYGNPLPQAATTSATVKVAAVAHAASDFTASDAAAQTVQTLTEALAAQGVTADVTPQVMNGTTLHALIMGENNGLPPTQDQFKTDPSGFIVANFELDDMVTRNDDPAQVAALAQFQHDLYTFIQRAHVAGKLTFVILPIRTCAQPFGKSAADGVIQAATTATSLSSGYAVGGVPYNAVSDASGVFTDTVTAGHMGADCRTPDAYLINMSNQNMAERMAPVLKDGLSK
ncbi:hypothetical protein QCE47_28030 [Caballeronia sp. LZ025]|uniref:hypothetical protein n=1 Tax=Caballeronia TaxID=1827195 RepID=UPI001FD61F48|nr:MULTISPECIES: hypothetical protein [Caballeronia]MDR5736166.1 hypothetical protein [Caballeronia sp. LZ025]